MALGSYAIGIDLGTANTCVGVYRDGQVEIVPHEGRSSMPSYVAFTETGRLIGAAAKNQAGINPKNTVFDALRLIGRKYSDPEIQADCKHFPFQVLEKKGKPVIGVEYRGDTKLLTPEEILSMILSRAKKDAEIYLGSTVKGAVITVPSYFNSSQRQAVKDAAFISDLSVFLLINGPTAACSDYMVTYRPEGERNVLIADFGAGTFNVMLAVLEEGILEVKSTASDNHLGGEDYDNRMVNHFVNEFKRRWKQDITFNRRALRRLRTACEAAKCELSSRQQTRIEIDSLYDALDFTSTITRTRFEELCQDLFRSHLEPVERVLRDGKMDKSSVHEIIVIGGSSRIPKIQKIFSDFFGGKELSKFLNPDETVARGAAIHAAIMSGYDSKSSNLNEFLLLDVAPLTLGIEAAGGVMMPLIRRNTTIPCKKSEVFSTFADNQVSFLVSVFEGERARTKDNTSLGKFSIPVSMAPRGVPQIEITFDCDRLDNKWVTATEKGTGKQEKIYLQDFDRLSAEEIERMKAEAQKYDTVDNTEAERVSARNALESYLYYVKSDVSASAPRNSSILRVATLADILLDWLDEHPLAPASEYLLRLTNLQEVAASTASESIDTDTTKVEALERVQSPVQPMHKPPPQPPGKLSPSAADTRMDTDSTPFKFSAEDWIATFKEPSSIYPSKVPLRAREGEDNTSQDASDQSRKSHKDSWPGSSGWSDPHRVKAARDSDNLRRLTEESAAGRDHHRSDQQRRTSPPVISPPETNRAAPALSEPIESFDASIIMDSLPPDTPGPGEKGMSELFSKSNGKEHSVYTDAEFIQISTYLRNTGRPSWSNAPRLYTVLRLIGQLPMLDAFVDQGITDIWFPFTSPSLPDDLSPSARASFLQSQSAVLSKALRFEKSSDRKHAHFAQGEPLPFEVIGRLGSGAHGYVDKVMSTISHREYARKLFRKTRGLPKDDIKSFLMELKVLKRVSHIHCVELVQSYSDPKYFALIMSPVAECNLFEYYDIASGSSDKLSLLRSFFGCLANALQYIHDIKIRHRDIKPQNVLVKADRVFLTDFGIALDWEHLSRSTTTADSGKTWPYAAPEVARYEKRNTSADVWSLGCVFLEMATILKGESVMNLRNFFKERNENYRFYANLALIPEWMDKLREIGLVKDNVPLKWVTHMLRETPEHRPTAAKLFNDISAECASQHIPFCGPCCREDIASSELDEDDDDELWSHEGEPTLESVEV